MHASFYDRRFPSVAMDECIACRGKITLTLVEPHPPPRGRGDSHHTCENCGPAKSRIVVCRSCGSAPLMAA
jgi:hypothetical protein